MLDWLSIGRYPHAGRIIVLGFVPAFVFLSAGETSASPNPAEVAHCISREEIESHHCNLYVSNGMNRGFSAGNPIRWPTNQHDLARDYIAQVFSNSSFQIVTQKFWFNRTYSPYTYTYTNACNIIAFKSGTDPEAGYYIVGAHYDSVDIGHGRLVNSPGADDNASGVAGVLELSRVLSRYSFKSSIILIAFDAEEKGLYGSSAFVGAFTTSVSNNFNGSISNIWRGNVAGMISMDMIAYNPGGANKARVYGGRPDPSPVKTNLAAAAAQYGGIQVFDSGQNNASDHGPFYITSPSMDSCVLIEDEHASNPYYHSVSDSVDSAGYIDYEFAARLTATVAGYLAEHATVVPTVNIAAAPSLVPENGSDLGLIYFYRDCTNGDLLVRYSVGGIATPNHDYAGLPGSVVISNGMSNATIAVAATPDNEPEGNETVCVSVLPDPAYGLGKASTATVTIADPPFDAWRWDHFSPEDLTNETIVGTAADPDNDGISNLLEYVTDSNPSLPDMAPILRPGLISVATQNIFVVYYDRRFDLTDAMLSLQACTDLLGSVWLDLGGMTEEFSVHTNGMHETVRARIMEPLALSGKLFIRLKATRP